MIMATSKLQVSATIKETFKGFDFTTIPVSNQKSIGFSQGLMLPHDQPPIYLSTFFMNRK